MSSKSFTVRLRAEIGEYRKAMRDAQSETAAVAAGGRAKFEALGSSMVSLGSTMTKRVTLPLVGIGVGAVKLAADFDTSMTRIQTLVGLGADEVDDLRGAVMNLSGSTAAAPAELADALFFITSAGQSGSEAMETLEASAKASAIGLGSVDTIAKTAVFAMNAYGKENLSAAAATDILAGAVKMGTLEASTLAPVLGNLLPTASALGISFEDVAGTMAVLSRTGADANSAATSLNATMAILAGGGTAQAKEALAEANLSMADLRATASEDGLVGVMRQLDETFGDNDEALSQIIPNVRAFRGFMSVLAQDGAVVDEVMHGVANASGLVSDGFDVVADSAGFKMKQAWVDLQVALIDVGNILLPLVTSMVDVVSGLLGTFQDLPGPVQTVIVGLAGLAAVAGPLLWVMGSLVKSMLTMQSAAKMVNLSMGTVVTAATGMTAALAVAGYMYTTVATHNANARRKVEEFRNAVVALTQELERGTTPIDMARQRFNDLAMEFPHLLTAMERTGITIEDLAQAATTSGSDFLRLHAELRDGADAAGITEDAYQATSSALNTAGAEVHETMRTFERLSAVQGEVVESTEEATEAVTVMARSIEDLALTAAVAEAQSEAISDAFQAIEDASEELQSKVDSTFSAGAAKILEFSAKGKESIGDFTTDLLNSLHSLTVWQNNLITIAERGGAGFAMAVAELGPDFADVVNDIANSTDEDFSAAMGAMVGYTDAAQRDMAAEFAKVDPEFKKTLDGLSGMTQLELIYLSIQASKEAFAVGQALGEGTAAGITSKAQAVANAAASMVTNAINAAKAAGDIQSPSRLSAEEVGVPLAQGVTVGFSDEIDRTADRTMRYALDSLVSATFTPMTGGGGPTNTTSTTTAVNIEHADFHDGNDLDAVYRIANLALAGVS